MRKKTIPKSSFSADIHGNVSGQIAVGHDIQQDRIEAQHSVTPQDMDVLKRAISQLRNLVDAESPTDKKDAALERMDELEQAMTEEQPDLSTMEYVRNWFIKNIPGLAGAVTSVVIHPIVGKLVEAAGDALSAEFRRRFNAPG